MPASRPVSRVGRGDPGTFRPGWTALSGGERRSNSWRIADTRLVQVLEGPPGSITDPGKVSWNPRPKRVTTPIEPWRRARLTSPRGSVRRRHPIPQAPPPHPGGESPAEADSAPTECNRSGIRGSWVDAAVPVFAPRPPAGDPPMRVPETRPLAMVVVHSGDSERPRRTPRPGAIRWATRSRGKKIRANRPYLSPILPGRTGTERCSG